MNIMNMMQMIQQFKGNPQQILQRFGIPQNCNTPDSVIKYLMDNGKVTQDQVTQAQGFYNSFFKR